jgi:NAD(P)-dependent dehydrogenase (short-subunit alcohol dehydrogenase family)
LGEGTRVAFTALGEDWNSVIASPAILQGFPRRQHIFDICRRRLANARPAANFCDQQREIAMRTKFGADSTTDEVLEGRDLHGKRVLVTGVSAGLGVETARALAAHWAQVVGTACDLAKARTATAGIPNLELIEMDLASLRSVRACADVLLARGESFDLVIANAGVMACPQGTTEDGFEIQFGTNHLGHFVLVNRIAPLLNEGARVVSVSSMAHQFSDVDLDDPGFECTPYEEWTAYGRSKTANVLFAVELDRRLRDRGIRAAAVHPGGIRTELNRHATPETMKAISERPGAAGAVRMRQKTVPQGAATAIWAGVVADAGEVGAHYCEDCHVAQVVTAPDSLDGVSPYALDPERAKALWEKSEELVGERF